MNVDFEIKLEEGINKNFLVFISTELTKKLKFELISTSTLEWEFKRGHAELILQHGKNVKESYQVEVKDRYGYNKGYETRYKDRLEPNFLILRFKDIENIESVNDVFDIVNKYAKLITDEYAESDSDDELVDMLDEVAATVEE